MASLYVVATPIGNLYDISERLIETLSKVDYILAEDTRQTQKLLSHLGIHNQLISYHKFNEQQRQEEVIKQMLLHNLEVAIVSDAGTPAISDPGSVIVAKAADYGISVIPIPGPSAVITGLSISGFDLTEFAFYGFLPRKDQQRQCYFERMIDNQINIAICYESSRRIISSLEVALQVLGDISIVLCNDLTKKFEKVYRGSICQVIDELRANPKSDKGEYTLIMRLENKDEMVAEETELIEPGFLVMDYMYHHQTRSKDAIHKIAEEKKIKKNQVYQSYLKVISYLKKEDILDS